MADPSGSADQPWVVDMGGSAPSPGPVSGSTDPDLETGLPAPQYDLPPIIPAHDAAVSARVAGYGWGDIQQHVDDRTQDALGAGYSQSEIDAHLGYSGPSALLERLGLAHADDPSLSIIRPSAEPTTFGGSVPPPEPGKSVGPVTPDLAQHYADALVGGEVKGPSDFADHYLDTVAPGMGQNSKAVHNTDISAQLPTFEDTADPAIAIAHGNGDDLDPATLRDARSNLLNLWAKTGQSPTATANQPDPLIHDAVTSPADSIKPQYPSLDALSKPGRDAINDVMGNMTTDPTGMVGTVKSIYNLPTTMADYNDKIAKMEADPNTDPAKLAEAKRDNPALDMLAQLALPVLGGKMLHAVADLPIGQIVRDESGSLKSTGVIPTAVQSTAEKISNARLKRPPELPAPAGTDVKSINTGMFDDLHRLSTNNTADKIELMQMVKGLPDEWKTKQFQEGVSSSVEGRLVDPNSPIPEDHQAFLNAMRPLTDKQRGLAVSIKTKLAGLANPDKMPGEFDVSTPEEGYVHRVVKGQEGGSVLPAEGEDKDVVTGQRQNTLSKFAGGVQRRQFYVFDNGAGTRNWGEKPLDDLGYKMGQTVSDGTGDWKIKPATMDEVEANTDTKYHRNFIANTVDNVARLARVDRNLDFLGTQAKALKEKGLFVPRTNDNRFTPPSGMREVNIPQMDGWAEPRIANTLNDFFGRKQDDLDTALGKVSRFLLRSLFITPFPHAENVAAHWFPARGWDWINPVGYGRLAYHGARAVREVWTQGPEAMRMLREGSGQILPSVETQNFYKVMQNQLFHTMLADQHTWGDYVRTVAGPGHAVVDLVKGMYRSSNEAMWLMNDVMLLQRQFELRAKGMDMREAIKQSEKDIPNYRVPSQVMGSPALSQFLQSQKYGVFGRYHYGMLRSLALMVRDLAGSARSPAERLEAAGKLTMLGVLGLGIYPLINSGLQQLTGNKNVKARWAGPLSVLHGVTGFAQNQVSWLSAMSSIFSMAPVLQLAHGITTGTDIFGRDIINRQSTPRGQVIQALEGAGSQAYPTQLLLNAMKPGGTEKSLLALLGVNTTQDPALRSRYQRYDRRAAQRRERNDPIESWINAHFPPRQ